MLVAVGADVELTVLFTIATPLLEAIGMVEACTVF